MNSQDLTPDQQAMVDMWEKHIAGEFDVKSIEHTMATMTPEPFVNHVPVMTGGVGSEGVRRFYSTYFIPGHLLFRDIRRIPRFHRSPAPSVRTV
jgi:carboxymethylenebutenolidase